MLTALFLSPRCHKSGRASRHLWSHDYPSKTNGNKLYIINKCPPSRHEHLLRRTQRPRRQNQNTSKTQKSQQNQPVHSLRPCRHKHDLFIEIIFRTRITSSTSNHVTTSFPSLGTLYYCCNGTRRNRSRHRGRTT